MPTSLSPIEKERISVLHAYHILDSPPDEQFDDLVKLATHLCNVPISAVTLIDENRQWFKAITGLNIRETPRELSFCAHTILQSDLMLVEDTLLDDRFCNNILVTEEPHIRFYAGVPLVTDDGHALGALCVIDRQPRRLTPDQISALRLLARQAASQLQQSYRIREKEKLVGELQAEREFQSALIESLQEDILACDAEGRLSFFNPRSNQLQSTFNNSVTPDQWAQYFGFYHGDGTTPMEMSEIPLYRALQGETVTAIEMVVVAANGPCRTVLANGRPIYSPSGEKLGAVVALHDITENRITEREIARLAAIVESSDDAIIGSTLTGSIVSWNKGAEQLYGYSASEIIGRPGSILAVNHEKGLTPETIARISNGEVLEPFEVIRETKDGALKDVSLSFSPIHDEKGSVIGISCISRDITRRKRAESAHSESEARLRLLSEAAFEGIVVTQDDRIVDANVALVKEFGYSRASEMIGLTTKDLAPDEYLELIQNKVESHNHDPYEAILKRRDGTTFEAEIRGQNTIIGGQTARITAIRNVTRQKCLEKELREREQALRAVFESAPIILYAVDANGTVTFSEGTVLAKLGLKPGEAIGRSVFDFSEGNVESDNFVKRALAGESVTYDSNIRGLWLHSELRPLQQPDGSPAGFIGVCFDVTERVASEERFRILFDQSPLPHIIFDETNGIIDCNSAAVSLMRCSDKSQLIGSEPASLSPELQPDGRRSGEKGREMCDLARQHSGYTFEWQGQAFDGRLYPLEICLTPVTLAGKPVILAVWHDLTKRKEQEEQIQAHAIRLESQKAELEIANLALASLATTDGLTSLKNHRTFQEQLAAEIHRSGRHNSDLSIIIVDVDNFKGYNDEFGHQAGDAVLKEFSRVLSATARSSDVVARYGGEEFVLILPETDLESAAIVAERLRVEIERNYWTKRPITASFGVSNFGIDGLTGEELIKSADTALYRSKALGRNRVSISREAVVC